MTLRVAFTTIWYPVAMGRYLFEALRRRPDTEVWTAGPYTGRWIPWAGGINLPMGYVHRPSMGLPLGSRPEVNYSLLEARVPWKPDLWLEANAGLHAQGRPKGRYAVIGTDPHVLDYSHARSQADFFFCMQKPYMKAGDFHLPYGYDPVWHRPTEVPWDERIWDAALLGLQYPQRAALVQELRSLGRNVRFELGPAYEDAERIYHSTRIGLNWSSQRDLTARVFELMAFGLASVLNRVPDLMETFVEHQHFIGFDTLDEALAAVDELLGDRTKAETMGLAALEAVRPHTWDSRIEQILKVVGLGN